MANKLPRTRQAQASLTIFCFFIQLDSAKAICGRRLMVGGYTRGKGREGRGVSREITMTICLLFLASFECISTHPTAAARGSLLDSELSLALRKPPSLVMAEWEK